MIPGDGERDVAVHRPVAAGERAAHVVHAEHVRLALHGLPVRRRERQPGHVVARRTQPHLADHAAERPEHAPQGAVGVAPQCEQIDDLEGRGVAGLLAAVPAREADHFARVVDRERDSGECVDESLGIGRERRAAARERAVRAAAQVSYTRQTASKSAGVARRVRTPAGAPIRASAAAGTSTVS